MARKKDSKPPEKPPADDIHTTPPEGLKEALEDSEDLAKKGKEALDEAVKSRTTPPNGQVVPIREEEPSGASTNPEESQEDLAEATGVFATSVDIITNALLVILGKFDESLKRTARLNTRTTLVAFLMVAIALAMGWSVWRIETIAEQLADARTAALEAASKQATAAEEMQKLAEALRQTEEKVDEVKAEQDKQPAVEVVPDNKGGAKVVITPRCDGDPKDCEPRPTPPPVASTAVMGNGPKIEIPIPGATTTKPAPQNIPPQAPPDH